jgi:hypothetical protein
MLGSLRNRIARLERRRFEAAERAADEFRLPPPPPHTPEAARLRALMDARLAEIEVPDGLSDEEALWHLRQALLADEAWMELHYRYIESLYMEGGDDPCPPSSSTCSGPSSGGACPEGPATA